MSVGVTKYGLVGYLVRAMRCASQNCNEVTVNFQFHKGEHTNTGWQVTEIIQGYDLRPESEAMPQPGYIPEALREDYIEACLIRTRSPKASATLARRCLQGMIRDFCGISENRLIDEINELKKRVDAGAAPKGVEHETMDAIDAVRSIGNIGAHMEKDIGVIVDVEPAEARALIGLIEMLFKDWYVARHSRAERLEQIKKIAVDKAAARVPSKP